MDRAEAGKPKSPSRTKRTTSSSVSQKNKRKILWGVITVARGGDKLVSLNSKRAGRRADVAGTYVGGKMVTTEDRRRRGRGKALVLNSDLKVGRVSGETEGSARSLFTRRNGKRVQKEQVHSFSKGKKTEEITRKSGLQANRMGTMKNGRA